MSQNSQDSLDYEMERVTSEYSNDIINDENNDNNLMEQEIQDEHAPTCSNEKSNEDERRIIVTVSHKENEEVVKPKPKRRKVLAHLSWKRYHKYRRTHPGPTIPASYRGWVSRGGRDKPNYVYRNDIRTQSNITFNNSMHANTIHIHHHHY